MNALSNRRPPTPRLLVVGLVVLGLACHHAQPSAKPAPVTPPAAPRPTPSVPTVAGITSGSMLVQAMHDRYAGKWYHNLTFVQKTTVGLASGTELPPQTWHEAGELPGTLRIDTDLSSKTGVLYARDSLFRFANGKLTQADTGTNELLVLGFDVYAQAPERTSRLLRRLGFDLTKFHEGTWQGRPVFVVGAYRGDTTSKQFWVDRDRLLFVRLLMNTRQGRAEFRFNKYTPAGGGWIAAEVEQFVNGKRRLLEEYTNIRTNVALSSELFDPRRWASAPHWVP